MILSIDFVTDSIGWYAGGLGEIYKSTTCGQWLTNIHSYSNQTPENFELHQNYPNPFNASTTIEFDIIESSNYLLEIFDIMGRRIHEIVNQNLETGKYRLNQNFGGLSSGVYYYKLSFKNNFRIRKFVLLK